MSNFKLTLKKNAPTIATAAGVVGLVGTSVLASRATLKAQDVVEQHKKNVAEVDSSVKEIGKIERESESKEELYNVNDYRKEMASVWVKTGVEMLKLYGPAIALGLASAGAIFYGHNEMQSRVAGLTSALNIAQVTLDKYRKQIEENLGTDQEKAIYDESQLEVEKDKNGKIVNISVPTRDESLGRFFDRGYSSSWQPSSSDNSVFLRCQENYFNEMLSRRGYVFLNEVYTALGFEETPEGQLLGWYVEKGKEHDRIEFISDDWDFVTSQVAKEVVSDKAVWLDFKVDGVIFDKIDKI
nr:MAG TPA: hypothetical protein [Caudoviricetes sp.]